MTPGRAAVVTGGSSGIGLAIARMLAEEGHALTLVARRPDRLEEAADQLRTSGAQVHTHSANLADRDAFEGIIEAHREAYGRLDVLVNNAAIATEAPIEDMPERRIDLQLDVNLRAIISAYRAALPLLRASATEHRNALVVNTASISARIPEPCLSIYAASKAAVIGFTRAMNKELGPDGIKSSVLIPGMVATPLIEHLQNVTPAEEMIQPSDIAEVVRMLLRVGPSCVVAELEIQRPGGVSW
jgi:NAD(P)-dependent dehydrogenase (short-subunit alcohol dehydrogenase family)